MRNKQNNAHKQTIDELLTCLDFAIPTDAIRPDILGFCLDKPVKPLYSYAIEVETQSASYHNFKKYQKQTAVKYVIFVKLSCRLVEVVSCFDQETDIPERIMEIAKKLANKLNYHVAVGTFSTDSSPSPTP